MDSKPLVHGLNVSGRLVLIMWWLVCMADLLVDFHDPQGALLGVINAAFGIGAVLVLPIVPWVRVIAQLSN